MFDNPPGQRPFDEKDLPPELAVCQQRLASVTLGPSQLGRDELMYRAGWAAAEAQASRRDPPGVHVPLARTPARQTTWTWSVTSAAVAATLAAAITYQLPRPVAEPLEWPTADAAPSSAPRTTGHAGPEPAVAEVNPPQVATNTPDQPTRHSPAGDPPQVVPARAPLRWAAPVLALRDRALAESGAVMRDDWDAEHHRDLYGQTKRPEPEPLRFVPPGHQKTARELLREMLEIPAGEMTSDWQASLSGRSVRWAG